MVRRAILQLPARPPVGWPGAAGAHRLAYPAFMGRARNAVAARKGKRATTRIPAPAPPDVSTGLAALRARLEHLAAPRREVTPQNAPVMLASLTDKSFSGAGWLFEPKYDGVRLLAFRQSARVELYMRSGQEVTGRYPELVAALRALPLERFLIDGEIVAVDEHGLPSFQRLQARMGLTRPADVERGRALVPVSAVFFDVLAVDGRDLRGLPLSERKALLALLLPARGVLSYGEHVPERGEDFFAASCKQQLEGIVAKKADSRYVGGRSRDWLKIKCQQRQEFVIGGYTDPQGARGYFGALHLGLYEGDRLVYVSKVGTGFDGKTLKQIWDRLGPLKRTTSPFAGGTPTGRGHHWVEPKLVCEVRYTEWTDDGGLRHPAFLGLREDKRPQDCRREVPVVAAPATTPPDGNPHGQPAEPRPQRDGGAAQHQVTISNPQKIFWPDEGLTKGDLVAYYEAVAPWLLPYLRDRPLVLTRYPDGIRGKSFFQKDTPEYAPSWIRTARIRAEEVKRDIDYVVVDDVQALRWVINLGTIPLHVWGSRVQTLEKPDWLVLDLDPKSAPFTDVVTVALALRGILESLEVPSYVKTSGKTGLHIFIPLGARYSYEQTRAFAQLLATVGVEAEPRIATVARPLHARGGKVYVDWGQNGRGQTVVAPFSVRPLPGAPISCPLTWGEVTPRLDPTRFTVKTARARLDKSGDPMAAILTESIDMAATLARIDSGDRPVARRRRT
jgi:bifunctional non-homologous end joining protein LigD